MKINEIAIILEGIKKIIHNLENEIDLLMLSLNEYDVNLTTEGEKIINKQS
jgi:hypothetical protein